MASTSYQTLEQFFQNPNKLGLDLEQTLLRLSLEVRSIRKKMSVLPTARETEALPELLFLKDLSAIMLTASFEETEQKMAANERIERLVCEDLFAGVCSDFLKTRIYTNKILIHTADVIFTNLTAYCTQRIGQGKQTLYSVLSTILDKNIDFYKTNGRESNIANCPFGVPIEPDADMIQWIDKLQQGTQIDCIKSFSNKQIWSRGVFESQDYNYARVRFFGETTSGYISNRYFDMRPLGTKSLDFDWRENLKKDDLIDYFNFKTGWVLCRVVATSVEENYTGEKTKFIEIKKEVDSNTDATIKTAGNSGFAGDYSTATYYDEFSGTLKAKVHNPVVAKPRSMSSKSVQQIDDSQDSLFLSQEKSIKYAILRPSLTSAGGSTHFVKYINVFGEHGGFTFLSNVCENGPNVTQDMLCQGLYLVKTLSDNLVQSYIQQQGEKFLKWLLDFAENQIEKNIRVYTQLYLSNFIDAVSTLSLRVFTFQKANYIGYDLIINIGVICLKSEILEKQFFGAKQILGIESKLKDPNFEPLRKKLSQGLIRESILDKVVKGHPSLITKSVGILAVLFQDNMIQPEHLSVIWDRISKTDSESRSALITLMKEISHEMSKEHIRFFLSKMVENLEEITAEILDLVNTLKKVGFNKHDDFEVATLVNDVTWKMLQSERDMKADVCKEIMKSFVRQVRNDQIEVYVPKIIQNFLMNHNKSRNLKLLIKLLKEPTITASNVTQYLVQHNMVLICVQDLNAKLESLARQIMHHPGSQSSVRLASTTDLKPSATENPKVEPVSELHREIKQILKFLNFKTYPKLPIESELFTFAHFCSIYDTMFKFSINDKLIKDWVINYLDQYRNSDFTEKCKQFFIEKVSEIGQDDKHEFLIYFTIIFRNVNLLERRLTEKTIRFETGFSHNKKQFETIRVCAENAETFFGMPALWTLYKESHNKKLYSKLAQFISKVYLPPSFGEGENTWLYAEQKKALSKIALDMFKVGDALNAQKSSLLLIQIIRNEEAKNKPLILSMSQLKESDKIQIFFEKDTKYIKDRFKVRVFENYTISQLKEIIATEYKISFDMISLARENGEKISNCDNFQTLEMMHIRENDTVLVQEADILEMSEVEMIDLNNKDFSDPVKLVWKEIFEEYSVDGKMFPKNFADFTQMATDGSKCDPTEERIKTVFLNNDHEGKGYLNFEEFIGFFRDSALASRDKQRTVKHNLTSLGYGKDYKLKKAPQSNQHETFQKSLRYQLCTDKQFYEMLIGYLKSVRKPSSVQGSIGKSDGSGLEFVIRLFEILGPSITDVHSAIQSPKDFVNGERNRFIINYRLTVLSSLIFNNDFVRGLGHFNYYISEETTENFLRRFLNPETFKSILDACDFVIAQENNETCHADLLPAIKLVDRVLKTCVSYQSEEFLNDLKGVLTFFMRQKKKSGDKSTTADVTAPTTTTTDVSKKNTEEKEGPTQEDEQISQLKSNFTQTEVELTFTNLLDFSQVNETMLRVLNFLNNTSKGDLNKSQRNLLKYTITSFAASSFLNRSCFAPLIHTDAFKKVMVQGLTHERGFLKVYYKNLYSIFASLFSDIRTKTEFLKNLISDIKAESSEEFSGLVDLACSILTEIGEMKTQSAEYADYIHREFNFTNLFTEFKTRFLTHQSTETPSDEQEDHLLTSYLAFLEKILNADEVVLQHLDQNTKQDLVYHIFNECLFKISDGTIDLSTVKCRSKKSRSLAFGLLQQILRNNVRLNIHFMVRCIAPLVRLFPVFQSNGLINPEFDKKPQNGFLGIKNLGCVCYMIATLQQFYCTPVFRHGILMARDEIEPDVKEIKGKKIDDNFFHQFQKMMAYLDYSERKDYSPLDFCLSYKDYTGQPLNVMVQQDADEFLKVVIDKIENSLKKSSFIGILNSVYLGKICNVIKCKGCGYVKTNEENFYNLSLEVKNMKNINESLEKLIEPEIISDYTCDSCKNKCDISKRALLKSLPNVLFLSLKKMCFDLEQLINIKIHTRYEFPMNMNLRKYMYVPDATDMTPENGDSQMTVEANTQQTQETIVQTDEDFEYKLVGVVIHKGNAEYGHYTSLINANRQDPSRKDITQDKWYEFDDSRVTVFDMKKFDEECFGSNEEKDFSLTMMSAEPNNSKSAYLLVYDKVKKNDLVFNFTKESEKEKDVILQSLVNPREVVVTENELRTGYYNLKQYLPEPYQLEIAEDNKLLVLEQQLLSRTFTNGMAEIFLNVDLTFDPTIDVGTLDKQSLTILSEKRIYAETVLQNLPKFMSKIFCVTNENYKIREIVSAMERAMYYMTYYKSVRPDLRFNIDEKIFNFFKDHIYTNYMGMVAMIGNSNDQYIQYGLSEYIYKITTATVRNFEILRLENAQAEENPFKQKALTFIYQTVYSMGMAFSQMDGSLPNIRKNAKLFYIASRLSEENPCILEFFAVNNLLNILAELYLKTDCSRVSSIEKCLAPILNLVFILYSLEKLQSEKSAVHKEHVERVKRLDIILKGMKEDYKFESFESLKKLVFAFATNDRAISEMIIWNSLKLMINSNESYIIGYLETFRGILTIVDRHSAYRIRLIFGIQRLTETVNSYQSTDDTPLYGLGKDHSLRKQVLNYVSPFGLEKGLLDIIFTVKENHESYVMLLMYYLVDYMLAFDSVFFYIISLDPPSYISATFYDWFLVYCEHHLKYDSVYYTSMKSDIHMLYLNHLPEKLNTLSKKLSIFIDASYPHSSDRKLFATGSNPYIAYMHYNSSEREGHDAKELWSFKKNYIIGRTISSKLLKRILIDECDDDKLKMRVHLVKVAMMPSKPTGQSNLVFPPTAIMTDYSINQYALLNQDLADFIDSKKPARCSLDVEDTQLEAIFDDELDIGRPVKQDSTVKDDENKPVEAKNSTDSAFGNIEYILRISISNGMSCGYFLKLEVTGAKDGNFEEADLLIPLKGVKNNYLIHTVCLKNIHATFEGLTIKLGWKKTLNANIKFLGDDVDFEMNEVFSLKKQSLG